MRYEPTSPMLPDKPHGMPRVNDRRAVRRLRLVNRRSLP
jgi:hypothetical protein